MATGTIKQVMNNSGSNYCKMPDGTLIQWGNLTNFKSRMEANFPIQFVGNNPCVQVTPVYNTTTTARCVMSAIGEKSKFTFFAFDITTGVESTSTTLNFTWIAIGRWK